MFILSQHFLIAMTSIFSICSLYNWRYKVLGDLPHVSTWQEYRRANPGLHFDFQLINVENFNGVGESEPNPYFYQVQGKNSDCGLDKLAVIISPLRPEHDGRHLEK